MALHYYAHHPFVSWPSWIYLILKPISSSLYSYFVLQSLARNRFKTSVLVTKAVSGTAPAYLQALVRPHAPLECFAKLPQLVSPSKRASKVTPPSHNSPLFLHCSSGSKSRLMSGQQSRSAVSAKDSPVWSSPRLCIASLLHPPRLLLNIVLGMSWIYQYFVNSKRVKRKTEV